ncbi:MAG: hypothetical protein BroJett003_03520 [Planctomycetota bacterium]|nr:MAG: hypothetical protein BroJett003_03520 [Planctomycetota bacterium]
MSARRDLPSRLNAQEVSQRSPPCENDTFSGAIQSDEDGQGFTIRNGIFENCRAESGGAIDLEKYPRVIEGCVFRRKGTRL